MQKLWLILITLFCTGLLSAGYKDFSWGLTPSELTERVPGLQKGNTAMSTMPADELFALSKQFFPNLMRLELRDILQEIYPKTQKYESFFSREEGLVFYFIDERLVCVGVDFRGKNPFQELALKHGAARKFYFLRANTHAYEGALWNTPERVIFYSAYRVHSGHGNIYYLDPRWLVVLGKQLEPQETPKNNSRVD